MGKLSKGFNKKARQKSTQSIEDLQRSSSELAKLVELKDSEEYKSTRDESNVLILSTKRLPSKKVISLKEKKTKKLTKKQKKKLLQIVDQKKKKEQRADILASLANVQVSKEELSLYKSTSKIGQSESLKRKVAVEANSTTEINATSKRRRNRKQKSNEQSSSPVIIYSNAKENEESSCDEEHLEIEHKKLSYDEEQLKQENKKSSCDEEHLEKEDIEEIEDASINKQILCKDIKNTLESQGNCLESTKSKSVGQKFEVGKEISKINFINTTKSNPVGTAVKDTTIAIVDKPIFVEISRSTDIQAARLLLPILAEEQVVMETIKENDVVIICGSTGSGKTTQVPQFLYEAGYGTHSPQSGLIGVTEPRRVAAVSMSKRVAQEMSLPESKVSYQIRYEGNTTDETVIKFMTDGVLLKEMETDFLLNKYSALIIDEAHERSVYTDILIGLLSRIVPMRNKQGKLLKLIIMSATLRIEDFTDNKRLFLIPPPTLKIDSRQYPVTIHFNKKTVEDYVSEAYKKVCKIHRTLKIDGGILVFLTGQGEVQTLCRKLRNSFSSKDVKPVTLLNTIKEKNKKKESLPEIDLDRYEAKPKLHPDEYLEMETDDEDLFDEDMEFFDNNEEFVSPADCSSPLYVLPLYSMLPSDKQAQVFSSTPPGCRLCVVATNVAETSLTIPGIKYIVDCGKVKKRFYDKITGMSTFRITWTSKASADQRTGRAGRVGPGHCYRLFSSAVFQNEFEEFSEAEIHRRPVDDLLLQMKAMCIDKVVNFPFPSPPDIRALQAAEKILLDLGALKKQVSKKGNDLAVITALGKKMSKIPVSPRFSKMILLAIKEQGCLQFIIAIVAALTVKEIFTDDIDFSNQPELELDDLKKRKQMVTIARRSWAGSGGAALLGDLMVILRAVGACEYAGCTEQFCKENGLRYKALLEIRKLRSQLTNAVHSVEGSAGTFIDPKMNPPTEDQATTIRKIVLSCFGDRVARKIPLEEAKSLKVKNAYKCCSSDEPVYIHPTSSLFTKLPEFIVYQEIIETSKLYMKSVISTEEEWLPIYAPYMCHFSKPLEDIPPVYDEDEGVVKCYMTCTYGFHVWKISPQLLAYPNCLEKYRWFARFLLEGRVIGSLTKFADHLVTPASIMLKSWAHLQPKTEKLLNCLLQENVDCKDKLIKVWKKNKLYLLNEYLLWVSETKHDEVKAVWPHLK